MFNKIYEKDGIIIFKVKNGHIVYNTKKEFSEGHTHLKSYNACVSAVNLVLKKKMSKSNNPYFLKSLIRLSNDEKYINDIESRLHERQTKGKYKMKYTVRR